MNDVIAQLITTDCSQFGASSGIACVLVCVYVCGSDSVRADLILHDTSSNNLMTQVNYIV